MNIKLNFLFMANLSIIQTIAKQKGITMSSLAEKSGLTQQALFQILRNNSTKVITLEKISEVLGVSPSVFFDGVVQNNEREYELLKARVESLELINSALEQQVDALKEANRILNNTLFH